MVMNLVDPGSAAYVFCLLRKSTHRELRKGDSCFAVQDKLGQQSLTLSLLVLFDDYMLICNELLSSIPA